MCQYFQYLEKIDYFLVDPIDVKIRKQKTKSWIGGLFTIFIITIILTAFVLLYVRNENKEDLRTYDSTTLDINSNPFFLSLDWNESLVQKDSITPFLITRQEDKYGNCFERKDWQPDNLSLLCTTEKSKLNELNGIGFMFNLNIKNKVKPILPFSESDIIRYLDKNIIITINVITFKLCVFKMIFEYMSDVDTQNGYCLSIGKNPSDWWYESDNNLRKVYSKDSVYYLIRYENQGILVKNSMEGIGHANNFYFDEYGPTWDLSDYPCVKDFIINQGLFSFEEKYLYYFLNNSITRSQINSSMIKIETINLINNSCVTSSKSSFQLVNNFLIINNSVALNFTLDQGSFMFDYNVVKLIDNYFYATIYDFITYKKFDLLLNLENLSDMKIYSTNQKTIFVPNQINDLSLYNLPEFCISDQKNATPFLLDFDYDFKILYYFKWTNRLYFTHNNQIFYFTCDNNICNECFYHNEKNFQINYEISDEDFSQQVVSINQHFFNIETEEIEGDHHMHYLSLKDVVPQIDNKNYLVKNFNFYSEDDVLYFNKMGFRSLFKVDLLLGNSIYTNNLRFEINLLESGYESYQEKLFTSELSGISEISGPFGCINQFGVCGKNKTANFNNAVGIFMISLNPLAKYVTIKSTKDSFFSILGTVGGLFSVCVSLFLLIKSKIYGYQNYDLFLREVEVNNKNIELESIKIYFNNNKTNYNKPFDDKNIITENIH